MLNHERSIDELTEVQAGALVVEDEEAARLALCRALGLPEPELYVDVDDDEEESLLGPADGEDWDRILMDIIDLQERMACGMEMIKQCNQFIEAGNLQYDAFCSWVQRRKNLWAHWHYLKACCDAQIGEDRWLWVKYFELAESDIDRTGYTEDVYLGYLEAIDTLDTWMHDSVDDYQD